MPSIGEVVQLDRFTGLMPGLIEPPGRDGCHGRVIIRYGNKKGRCIFRHWHHDSIARVDTSREIGTAQGIMFEDGIDCNTTTSRKAHDPDPVRINAPFCRMLTYKTDRLTAVFFAPEPGFLCWRIRHWRIYFHMVRMR